MCGQYKANHVCPFVVDRTRRTTAQQTDPVFVPRVSLEGAVTITVRRRPKLPELKAEPTA